MHIVDSGNIDEIKRETTKNINFFKKLFTQLGLNVDDNILAQAYESFMLQYLSNSSKIEVNLGGESITFNLLSNSFSLANMFGKKKDINCYFVCTNSKNQNALIKFVMEDGYDNNTGTAIIDVQVLLPIEERDFYDSSLCTIKTYNRNTKKYGEYHFISGLFYLEEKYDLIESEEIGTIVSINDKKGRVSGGKLFNIPIRYDELSAAQMSSLNNAICYTLNNVILVRQGNFWGAYCYMPDFHERYDVSEDREWKQQYTKKRFIPPMFQDIKIFNIDKERVEITLEVSLNGKVGMLEAFGREFTVPTIFDTITYYSYAYSKSVNDYVLNCYGFIDGVEYFYDGNHLTKVEPIQPLLSDDFIRVRSKIEKKKF